MGLLNEYRPPVLDLTRLNPFFAAYLTIFQDVTDSPLGFILTTLFASLGGAIGINRWIRWGQKKVYPNVWTMLVGNSTRTRKNTALSTGLYFNHLFDDEFEDRNFILPSDGSFAGFLKALETEKQGVLVHPEVATLLENMNKGFNTNMKSMFTNFFDVPPKHKIYFKNSHDVTIAEPIFSMATATTINWFRKYINADDRESGFLARFIYFHCEQKDRSLPIPGDVNQNSLAKLRVIYESLFDYEPAEITFDESFREVYTKFYLEIDTYLEDPLLDEGTKTLVGRLQVDYFLKFTIIECVLSNKKVATAVEARRAEYLARFYLSHAVIIMNKALKNETAKSSDKIITFLKRQKSSNTTDLLRLFSNNLSASKLHTMMNSLIEAGLVKQRMTGKSVIYEFVQPSYEDTNFQPIE